MKVTNQGVKAVYETHLSGPVKVRVLAVFSTTNYRPLEAVVQVTSKTHKTWPRGYLTVAVPTFLWEKHRFIGKTRSLYEGRQDLSGLPLVDDALLHAMAEQNHYH